jgi:long-chain fatty acid transport protein
LLQTQKKKTMGEPMGNQSRIALSTAFLLVALSSTALAGGFSVREQSAEGLGSAFAGIAGGTDGLSAMFWNPATISQHNAQGYVSENNISAIIPYSRAKNGATTPPNPLLNPDSGNIGVDAIVPASYSVYGLTDEITLGMAISAPFGLSTNSDVWTGSLHGDKSDVFTMNFNPMVAYKPADWITVAAGVQGEYMKVKLSSQTPTGVTVFHAKADDIAFGFTAGILLEPSDDLDIGIGFRSSMNHGLDGSGVSGPVFPAAAGDVSARFKTPEMLTFGVKYQLDDQWKLMGGAEWANWSRFKRLAIQFDGTPVTLATTENWKDSWFFSAGAEYELNDKLTLRSGVAYEKSPVPDSTRTPRLPDNDRYWLSVGASYKVNDWLTTNLAYSHVFMDNGNVALAGPPTPLTATFKQHLDIASISAVIDW